MKIAAFSLLLICFCFSCKQKTKQGEIANKTDTTKFFQVSEFVRSQIEEVNETPYFIYRINRTGGREDSSAINTATFNQISSNFLNPDINNTELKKQYTESIFHDQTTKSFTISYSTSNKDLQIQNVEVLLKEDGQTVKRLFMRKFLNYQDSSIIEQLSWKTGQSFEINRLIQKRDNKETSSQTIVVWE